MHSLPTMFIRRLGQQKGMQCENGHYCPQLLEMADGDFAAVGPDITDEAIEKMLPGPGIGPNERAIRIPRRVMVASRADIPAA